MAVQLCGSSTVNNSRRAYLHTEVTVEVVHIYASVCDNWESEKSESDKMVQTRPSADQHNQGRPSKTQPRKIHDS